MMSDYRLSYIAATIALAISALSKTFTYILLRFFADDVLGQQKYIGDSLTSSLIWIGLGFIGLAAIEGTFAFLSGRLAAYTAEGITRRLRDFLFDHIQRLSFSYHATTPTGDLIERVTSDVDALRRFFAEQAIGVGRIILLFVINFVAIYNLNAELALVSIVTIPIILLVSIWFFKKGDQSLRRLSGTGGDPLHDLAGKPDRRARGESLCAAGLRKKQVREG